MSEYYVGRLVHLHHKCNILDKKVNKYITLHMFWMSDLFTICDMTLVIVQDVLKKGFITKYSWITKMWLGFDSYFKNVIWGQFGQLLHNYAANR